jgi:hypothetical protein
MEAVYSVTMDHRLKLFDQEVNTNVNSSRSLKSRVKRIYENKCLFCGTNNNVTIAHIVSHNDHADYSRFQPPIYKSVFDPKSIRNRILLCGTKTERGTCHNLFDHYNIAIVYNPLQNSYDAVCVSTDSFRPGMNVSDHWELHFPSGVGEDQLPYKRLLAWRIRKCALTNASSLSPEQLHNFVTIADLSEADEVPRQGESEEESLTTEGKNGEEMSVS